MCPSQQILNQTKNGLFTYCESSKLFQFVFNNLCFELYGWELEKFMEYLENLDIAYWEKELKSSLHSRKIPITVGHNHFIILVNRQELEELKCLLMGERSIKFLNVHEIGGTLIYN